MFELLRFSRYKLRKTCKAIYDKIESGDMLNCPTLKEGCLKKHVYWLLYLIYIGKGKVYEKMV